MIEPAEFLASLRARSVNFFCGVPDSLLKDFCAYVANELDESSHVITANEGASVGLALGHYLASGNPALVYMQNSGLGNAVNPLLSLADSEVYGVPMVLLIGWRGELAHDGSQATDEPQHKKQGKVTLALLEAMGIKYFVLGDGKDYKTKLDELLSHMEKKRQPVAIVARKGLFSKCTLKKNVTVNSDLSREKAIELILQNSSPEAVFVATTGMISRELFELREKRNESHAQDFLVVGGMGHCSQIAYGVAKNKPDTTVYCLDGDGAVIMHLGSLAISSECRNLHHIVLNNAAHDSVGGQPTCGLKIRLDEVARSVGYKNVMRVDAEASLKQALSRLKSYDGSTFLEVIVKPGNRADLGRPTQTPVECKDAFMSLLKKN